MDETATKMARQVRKWKKKVPEIGEGVVIEPVD
jgi:hypothetical protein